MSVPQSRLNLGKPDIRAVDVLTVVCLIAAAGSLFTAYRSSTLGFDFKGNEWESARDILRGHGPYHIITAAYLGTHSNALLLPPPAALFTIPLAALPFSYAFGIWTAASLGCFLTALRLVGLRDWRCYALACVSLPLMANLELGQLSGFLALGYALVWRVRERRYLPGAIVALLIALKLFAWPLLLWFAFTRRWSAALVGVVAAPAIALGSWAIIGFQGLAAYPHALAADARAFEMRTNSVPAVMGTLGLSAHLGDVAAILVGAALIALALVCARRGNDVGAFAAATGAGIYSSPVLHPHYLLLIVVALAIARPELSWAWLGLVMLWFSPREPPLSGSRLDLAVLSGLLILLSLTRAQDEATLERHREPATATVATLEPS